jgi:hypothetical protein
MKFKNIGEYRAWTYDEKEIFHVRSIMFDQGLVALTDSPEDDDAFIRDVGEVILMQDSGLVDAHCNSIFDLDVLVVYDEYGANIDRIGFVGTHGASFMVEVFNQIDGGFYYEALYDFLESEPTAIVEGNRFDNKYEKDYANERVIVL